MNGPTSGFVRLLQVSGFNPDDLVSVCYLPPEGQFTATLGKASDAPARAAVQFGRGDVFYGANPLRKDANLQPGQRGSIEHVGRILTLCTDLDTKPKPGGLGSEEACREVINQVSALFGGRQPVAVVHSGTGGMHPRWKLEPYPPEQHPRAVRTLRRFGRAVRAIARQAGGAVDSVHDPARVWRVPGSVNLKPGGGSVTVEFYDTDNPDAEPDSMTLDIAEELLDEAGVPDESEPTGEVEPRVPLEAWPPGTETCSYFRSMVAGWAKDNPPARHPRLLDNSFRLMGSARLGCCTPADFIAAMQVLEESFANWCARPGDTRAVKPLEVPACLEYAREAVEHRSEEACRAELGNHVHTGGEVPGSGSGQPPEGSGRRVPTGGASRGRRLQVTRASDITMKRVRWAYKTASGGRMPVGELAIVAGQPGRGKSTKVNQLGALMTRGLLPGEFYGHPRSIIVSATEESWETTIAPKMAALGADMGRVLKVDALVYMAAAGRSISMGLDLGADMAELEDLMKTEDVGMLILDPIISRLGKLDTHKDAEVRVALDPLVEVLHNTGAVGIGIMHFNKGQGDALKLLMGSTAFGAVARSVHVVEKDPDSPGERLFATVKANMGRDDLPMVRFRLEEASVDTLDGPATVAVAIDLGEDDSGRSFDEVQRQMRRDSLSAERQASGVRTVIDEAVDFLAVWLGAHDYSGKSSAIKAAAAELDIPEMTLKRARVRLKVAVSPRDGFGGETWWTWSADLHRRWLETGKA